MVRPQLTLWERLEDGLFTARKFAARWARILVRMARAPAGITAAREYMRQKRDYLAIADRLAAGAPPVVVVRLDGAADAIEMCLESVVRHTNCPHRLLLLAPAASSPPMAGLLRRFEALPHVIVHHGVPQLALADLLGLSRRLAGDADLVLLDSSARPGRHWLQELRLAAYCDEHFADGSQPRLPGIGGCAYVRRDLLGRIADAGAAAEDGDMAVPEATFASAASGEIQFAERPLPRALFVVSTRTGGTPRTNEDLMRELAGRYDTLVLRCNAKSLELMRWSDGAYRSLRIVRLPGWLRPFPHIDAHYDRVVAGWLAEYRIEIVHIRHLVWHSLSLPRLARALGIPVVFSFHDYYAICPTIRLVDEHGVFCGGDCTAGAGPCKYELWRKGGHPALKHAAVYDWRESMAAMLASCDAFVTTSASARDLIRRFFPVTHRKPFLIIEHGRDFPQLSRIGHFPEPGEKVRVLVPGNISPAKGADILQGLQRLNVDGRYEFHLLGEHVRELRRTPNLVFHGPYRRERFGDLVREIDPHFGVVLSIWAETFCHTLTEMWACGLPVAAFDLGAVGERIRRHGAGWLIEAVTPEATFRTLEAIVTDRVAFEDRLAELAAWQDGPAMHNSCAWMADAYDDVYRRLLYGRSPTKDDIAA